MGTAHHLLWVIVVAEAARTTVTTAGDTNPEEEKDRFAALAAFADVVGNMADAKDGTVAVSLIKSFVDSLGDKAKKELDEQFVKFGQGDDELEKAWPEQQNSLKSLEVIILKVAQGEGLHTEEVEGWDNAVFEHLVNCWYTECNLGECLAEPAIQFPSWPLAVRLPLLVFAVIWIEQEGCWQELLGGDVKDFEAFAEVVGNMADAKDRTVAVSLIKSFVDSLGDKAKKELDEQFVKFGQGDDELEKDWPEQQKSLKSLEVLTRSYAQDEPWARWADPLFEKLVNCWETECTLAMCMIKSFGLPKEIGGLLGETSLNWRLSVLVFGYLIIDYHKQECTPDLDFGPVA